MSDHPTPGKDERQDCAKCGVSDAACLTGIRAGGHPCCRYCYSTQAHELKRKPTAPPHRINEATNDTAPVPSPELDDGRLLAMDYGAEMAALTADRDQLLKTLEEIAERGCQCSRAECLSAMSVRTARRAIEQRR